MREWVEWFWSVAPAAIVVLVVLAVFTMVGYAYWEEIAETNVGKAIRESMRGMEEWAGPLLPLRILVNNLVVSLVVMATAVTLVVPLAVVAYNGVVVGYVVALAVREAGMTVGQAVLYLLPHGAVELAAIALAAGVSLRAPSRRMDVYRDVVRVAPAVAGLLVIAAVVEVVVTPIVASIAG